MIIPLSNPDITDSEREKVLEVLNTTNLSLGPKLNEFEDNFSSYIGSNFAIAVNSGTSGLHLCVRALNIKEGDEVLTTPFSFISSANCILFERGKPIFVDIDEKTLNIDVNKLEEKVVQSRNSSSRLKAILPVHVFGRPCKMDEIMEIANNHKLKVIEDACEAIGAEYFTGRSKNKNNKKIWQKIGTFGECGVFAFYPNKQITTGEGGMIVTDDENIYKLCRSMRNQGRSEKSEWLQHVRLGYNYRISDINCSIGIAQLERIDEILEKRGKIIKSYEERLDGTQALILPRFEQNKKISWFVYVVRLNGSHSREERDLVLYRLRERGIQCSNYFSPIHLQPFYKKMFGFNRGDFPVTEKVSESTIALPFYNNLRDVQIDYICENLKQIIHSL